MSLLLRIRQAIAPDCGHAVELEQLRKELTAARLARQEAVAERYRLAAELAESEARFEVVVTEKRSIEAAAARLEELLAATERKAAPAEHQIELVSSPARNDEEDAQPADASEEELSNKVLPMAFRLVGIYFDEGPGRRHNWLLDNGDVRVKLPIADTAFMKRVAKREQSFGAGDTLCGDIHVVTWRTPSTGAVRVEYRAVQRVERIVHPDEHVPLPFMTQEAAHA